MAIFQIHPLPLCPNPVSCLSGASCSFSNFGPLFPPSPPSLPFGYVAPVISFLRPHDSASNPSIHSLDASSRVRQCHFHRHSSSHSGPRPSHSVNLGYRIPSRSYISVLLNFKGLKQSLDSANHPAIFIRPFQ